MNLHEDLERIVNYMLPAEETDYQRNPSPNHIAHSLRRVAQHLAMVTRMNPIKPAMAGPNDVLRCPECDAVALDGTLYTHSLVSHRTRSGKVHIAWGEQHGQVDPEDARKIGLQFFEVAEAAISDAAIFNMLTSKTEERSQLSDEQAMFFVGNLRRHRQDA